MPISQNLTPEENATMSMAVGRLFRLMSRPYQPGDDKQFADCRSVIMNLAGDVREPYTPCWVRDRDKGAAGQ